MGDNCDGFYDYKNGKMTLLLSYLCNLRCLMCGDDKRIIETLSREKAFDVAKFAIDMGFQIVEITGGEPFLQGYTADIVDYMCSSGIRQVFVTTNATLLNSDQIKQMAKYKNIHVQVSFDGIEDSHNYIRRSTDAFQKAYVSFRDMAELGISLSINTVIQRRNLGDLLPLYRMFADVPYKWHAFCLYEPGSPNMDKIGLNADDAQGVVDELTEIFGEAQAQGKPVVLSKNFIDGIKARLLGIDSSGVRLHPGLMCTVPRRKVVVLQDGSVLPCKHRVWPDEAKEFNVNKQPIKDVIFSEKYKNNIIDATVLGKCTGCSTMCYSFDPDFNRKMLNPTFADLMLVDAEQRLRLAMAVQ